MTYDLNKVVFSKSINLARASHVQERKDKRSANTTATTTNTQVCCCVVHSRELQFPLPISRHRFESLSQTNKYERKRVVRGPI